MFRNRKVKKRTFKKRQFNTPLRNIDTNDTAFFNETHNISHVYNAFGCLNAFISPFHSLRIARFLVRYLQHHGRVAQSLPFFLVTPSV